MTTTDYYILAAIWIVYIILLLVAYHKIFDVVYFDTFNGLLRELVIAAIIGAILAGVTIIYWWISTIVLILIGLGLGFSYKEYTVGIIIAFAVLAIFISIFGYKINKRNKENKSKEKETVGISYDVNLDGYF